jgi:prophage regulatory protein
MEKRPTKIIRRPAVVERTGLPVSSLYLLIAQGRFPKPVAISERSVGWVEAEVDAWLEARIARRDMEAA